MSSFSPPNSILDQICSEYGHPEKVRIRDVESVNRLIHQLIHGEAVNLQVITDFDFTLSKAHTKGTKCSPAADIIRQNPLMSDEFKDRAHERYDRLLVVELDSTLTIDQKTPTVISSFQEGFTDLLNSKKLCRKSLAQMIANENDFCNFQLRDRCHITLKCLNDAKVPVLIFSAGFGDVIQGLLHKYALYYPNIHVIANFMEFNEVDEQLTGFKEPLIHTYNKNESVIPENCQYFGELTHRSNVILLGDSIGDVSMAKGAHKAGAAAAILKIGFLNEVDEHQLDIFLGIFDIVLYDDETMDFVNNLLKKIVSETEH